MHICITTGQTGSELLERGWGDGSWGKGLSQKLKDQNFNPCYPYKKLSLAAGTCNIIAEVETNRP